MDKNGNISLINKKGCEVLGYSEEELMGKQWFSTCLPPKLGKQVYEDFKRLLNGELEPIEFYENPIITKNGEERLIAWHNSLIYDNKINIVGTLSSGEDITERKKTEQKLKESEQQYRVTINALGDPIHVIDNNYKIILANDALVKWVKNLNLNPDLMGKTPKEAWPFLPDLIMEEYRLIFKNGNPIITVESNIVGNREITTETRKIPIFNEKIVIQIITVMRDITEKKEAEQKLKDSEENYRILAEQLAAEKERLSVTLHSIGDGVITTDRDGIVVYVNKVAESLTGFKQVEANGKHIEEIFRVVSVESGKPIEKPIARIISTESIINLSEPMILTSKNGKEYIINDSGAPIRDKESKIIGVVLVFRDITEQRRIETELFKNQRIESVGMLAGGIAHDFNNILTSIMGNFSLIKLDLEKNSNNYQFLLDAESGVNQATGLARQLLTFSKGGEPIKEKEIIEKVIEESAKFSIRGSGIDLKIIKRNKDELWSVNIDKSQIGQVIQNLVINAIQSMESKGIITIEVSNISMKIDNKHSLIPGNYVKVDVIDTGCGISAESLPKIFDLYYSTKINGSGLGLPICHSIISKHGGIITVDSKVNEGSTFTFFIPAESDIIVPDINKSELLLDNNEEFHNFKILILEDEEVVSKIMDSMLNRFNFKRTFTKDGLETYNEYKNSLKSDTPYDLVILDLTIPGGMGGEETMKKLLELDPSVKAIVTSGYAIGKILSNYQQYGFKDVLVKPYTVREFIEVIQKLLKV